MAEIDTSILDEKVSPDYPEGVKRVADMLTDLPEPMRLPIANAMISFVLFQG